MRVLLIDVDSLRPDHLGCYGYERDTSPVVDVLADDGVVFTNCFASDTPCLPSRTGLATARHGIKSGVVTHFGSGQWYREPGSGHRPNKERRLSFRQLSEDRFEVDIQRVFGDALHTACISSFPQRHLAYHFNGSFRESIQPTTQTGLEDGGEVTAVAADWLDRHAADDDWLLHVNYWEPHTPYHGIEPYLDEVRDSGPPPSWPDQAEIDAQQAVTGGRTATIGDHEYAPETPHWRGRLADDWEYWPLPTEIREREDFVHLVDGYDASVRKVDHEIGRLLDVLERHGVREETLVVVTADHGEQFGEHGIFATHGFANPACQQVPMVVSWPAETDHDTDEIDDYVYQFDLLPTICELADVSIPGKWDAEPFTPAVRGKPFEGRDFLVCGNGVITFSRAVYTDRWAFIRLIHPGVYSYPGLYNDPPLPKEGLELLHDLESDPHMTENLLAERPKVAAEMRAKLDGWVTGKLRSHDAAGVDPLVRMASEHGPFLYNDPEHFLEAYRDRGADEAQIRAVKRSTTDFPKE